MNRKLYPINRIFPALLLFVGALLLLTARASAQDTVTGAFEGTVNDSLTAQPIAAAEARIINQETNVTIVKRSDSRGRFYQGLLSPGLYTIRVSAPNYKTAEIVQRLFITRTGEVVPVPVTLDPLPAGVPISPTATATPGAPATAATPAPGASPTGGVPATPGAATGPTPGTATPLSEADTDLRARINATDARRGGSFTEEQVSTLPLGDRTLVRTFDELTLLLPGVADPPQTLGSVAGPGVGAGVGSAGQFSVNGLRSRANNFTIDGSDNNDEDIGVRRQGFVDLNSQPVESVKEYQAITLLAPAQFGRNIGAQVNAVSKSGGNDFHGILYGFLNASQLNARNFFDGPAGNGPTALMAGPNNNQPVQLCDANIQNCRDIMVQNPSKGKDSFTFYQGGLALGGPIKPGKMFFFVSLEREIINATQTASFAVPTVDQRGINNTGATGLFMPPVAGQTQTVTAFPTTPTGDAIFSLYPFPNNPGGVYGRNTYTEVLPASGRGFVLSGKFDENFKGGTQTITGRYNFTNDDRIIPVTGQALFSTLRPRVRTQNFSFFYNSDLSNPASAKQIFNQARLSYGRTRLVFDEIRDPFEVPSAKLPGTPFLLNAPLIENNTLPGCGNSDCTVNIANTGPVMYAPDANPANATAESALGPVGQVNIAGYSPVGVDVFNFPQQRTDNTYQVADDLTIRSGNHTFVFGTDNRRTELNSILPRNARTLINFDGAPQLAGSFDPTTGQFSNLAFSGVFFGPNTFAAAGAPSAETETLAMGGESGINLHYYQINFFGQDEWRVRPRFSISFGLRYEYNTAPVEAHGKIEDTFNSQSLGLIPGLSTFIGSRSSIFQPSGNNFAPRLGFAYSPEFFGTNHVTVIRAGYGIFYDQIIGAVVSQSRNVYPTYATLNLAGGFSNFRFVPGSGFNGSACTSNIDPQGAGCPIAAANPQLATLNGVPIVEPGTLNTINPAISFAQLVQAVNGFGTGGGALPAINGFGLTIPSQTLKSPMAQQYSVSIEQQLGRNFVISAAYAGTLGRHLLRFTTPNLGRNSFILPLTFCPNMNDSTCNGFSSVPMFFGLALPPGTRVGAGGNGFTTGRPVPGVGPVNEFETTANSSYNSLQLQLRGRFTRNLQFEASYTYSHAIDDVSDVFDLAGASALPQDSFSLAAERGDANFDVRHRFTYDFTYDFPRFNGSGEALNFITRGLELAGTGRYSTGQPFTINSIYDVNLDGNLTDRPNSTNGLVVTGNPQRPVMLTVDPLTLLAPAGQDGAVGRNTFRAAGTLELDMALVKTFNITERQKILLRVDCFNFINHANFGIPVRYLEAQAFGEAVNTITPGRRFQFALKYEF